MTDVLTSNQYWVKQQRGSPVVFNAFVAYNSATDAPRVKRRNFFHCQEFLFQSIRWNPVGTPIAPVLQTGDSFIGNDTYGWPEPDPPWWKAQVGNFVRFTTSFSYNSATDAGRLKKQAQVFPDMMAGSEYLTFIKRQNSLNMGLIEFLALVTVPNVIGDTLDEATTDLGLFSLNPLVIGYVYDSINPAGTVSIQFPAAGQLAFTGSSVSLTMSLGPTPPPPYPGITLPDAIFIAINADLVVGQPISWQYDPTVPYNYVISQDPASGTTIPQQSVVHFVASLGPAPTVNTATVPDVVGIMILDAQNSISISGCNAVNVVWAYSTTVPGDYVISQSIAAGSVVALGTQVALVVSAGSPVTTLPGATIVTPTMH